jgi:hypothetical protein
LYVEETYNPKSPYIPPTRKLVAKLSPFAVIYPSTLKSSLMYPFTLTSNLNPGAVVHITRLPFASKIISTVPAEFLKFIESAGANFLILLLVQKVVDITPSA